MNILISRIRILAIICCFMLCNTQCYAADKDINTIWKAVENYLQWNNFWFDHFTGEECFKKLIGKKMSVKFVFSKAERGDGICHYIEKAHDSYYIPEGGQIKAGVVTIHIAHTNMLFTIIQRGNKYIADIDLGEGSGRCEAGMLVRNSLNQKTKGENAVIISNLQIPNIKARQLLYKGQNMMDQVVLDAIKRSMSALIYDRHNEVKLKGKLLVGRFSPEDPFLLVYYPGDNTIYVFEFPSRDVLARNDNCMMEKNSFNLDRPQGEDERIFFESLYQRLLDNSIVLDLGV